MKKLIIGIISLILFTSFYIVVTYDSREKIYLLNWGEYIDTSLIEEFENEFNVEVVYEEVGSSEAMYTKVKSGTTRYDIVVPGDYIIQKMYNDNLLEPLNYELLTNYKQDMYHDDLINIMNQDDFYKNSLDYTVPYFWGAYSILYRTDNQEVVNSVIENGFNVFMDKSLTPTNTKIGMYDVPRWAVSSYLLANDIDVNISDLSEYEDDIVNKMSSVKYNVWADDMLKKSIASGNLDIAFTQLGDFFDQHYVTTNDGLDVNFTAYIPDNTAAFFDGLVIPKSSNNKDLAHEFINFFMDADNATQNALYVGYSPTIKDVVSNIENDINDEFEMKEFIEKYPFYLNPLQGKNAVLFKDLGVSYQSNLITLVNKIKNNS